MELPVSGLFINIHSQLIRLRLPNYRVTKHGSFPDFDNRNSFNPIFFVFDHIIPQALLVFYR